MTSGIRLTLKLVIARRGTARLELSRKHQNWQLPE